MEASNWFSQSLTTSEASLGQWHFAEVVTISTSKVLPSTGDSRRNPRVILSPRTKFTVPARKGNPGPASYKQPRSHSFFSLDPLFSVLWPESVRRKGKVNRWKQTIRSLWIVSKFVSCEFHICSEAQQSKSCRFLLFQFCLRTGHQLKENFCSYGKFSSCHRNGMTGCRQKFTSYPLIIPLHPAAVMQSCQRVSSRLLVRSNS